MKELRYILTGKQKMKLVGLLIIIIFGAVLETVSVSAILPVVYLIMDEDSIQTNQYINFLYMKLNFNSTKTFTVILIVLVSGLYILKNVFLAFRNYCQYSYVNNTQRELAEKMMGYYIRQPYIFHTQNNSAVIQRNVIQDAGTFIAYLLALIDIVVNASLCILLLSYMIITDTMITLFIALSLGIFSLIFFRPYNKLISKYGTDARECGEKMIRWINQSLGGIKEVKILEKENYFISNFSNEFKRSANAQKMSQFMSSVPGLFIEAVCMAGVLLSVAIKINTGSNPSELIPQLSVIAMAGMKILSAFNCLTAAISRSFYTKPACDALYKDLKELNVTMESLEDEKDMDIQYIDGDLKLINVSFSYPQTTKLLLDNVSFSIKKGTSVAFIGPSGMGKTTLADNILGVLYPTQGHIRIGELDMMDNLHIWHKLFGYIPQNIYLMDDTIRNNIAFGMKREEIDDEKIWKALELAQLKEFVENLENGLDTEVGEWGAKLSGGQRQRIGIARALLNEPKILLLDEATSALDNETERMIMESVDNLHGKVTVIIIAHRLSTIRNCDHIFEVNNGKVLEIDKKEFQYN